MPHRHPRTRLWVSAVLVWIGVAGCPPKEKPPTPPDQPGPAADTTSPQQAALKDGTARVREASLTLLDSAGLMRNALLEVRYDAGVKPGSSVTIQPDSTPIKLHDDGQKGDRARGDSIFSAEMRVNLAEFEAEQRELVPALRRVDRVPQFEGRVRVGFVRVPRTFFQDVRELRLRAGLTLAAFAVPNPFLKERSLVINNVAVVTDPARTFNPCTNVGTANGLWTFGHLMTQMANQAATGIAPPDFARSWLAQWETPQTVNSFTIPARANIVSRIVQPWLAASGGTTLDMTKAPFRLLAIVNRLDLRQNLLYGGGSAGEARFVFGAVDLTNNCAPLPFSVIFEYGITKNSCQQVKEWGKQWYALRTLDPTSTAYRDQLEAITQQFVAAGADPGQLPNQNALNQLRTNERTIGTPWELREFALVSSGRLASVTVKQEPEMTFENTPTLAAYANDVANAAKIVADRHEIPVQLNGQAFLGARSPIPGDNTSFVWRLGGPASLPGLRHHLSFNTCSGCHTGETKAEFYHIDPRTGPPATLSGFLTGIDVTDIDGVTRHFEDLANRAEKLELLVNSPCLKQLNFRPIKFMVH